MPDFVPFLRGFTVAGLSFRTLDERSVANNLVPDQSVLLVPEPTNVHDPFAVKIMAGMSGDVHIGYVPKESSAAVAFVLANGGEYVCTCAGRNKSNFPHFNLSVK